MNKPVFSYDTKRIAEIAAKYDLEHWTCNCQNGKNECFWHDWADDLCFHCGKVGFHDAKSCDAKAALTNNTHRTATWFELVQLKLLARPPWWKAWRKGCPDSLAPSFASS